MVQDLRELMKDGRAGGQAQDPAKATLTATRITTEAAQATEERVALRTLLRADLLTVL